MKLFSQRQAASRVVSTARAAVADWLPDVLMVAGAAAVAYGAALVYFPAGFLVGGALLGLAGWLLARSSK